MTTPLKYLTIAGLAITALIWPSLKLNATEVEEERDVTEDVGAREAYRRLQLQDENGQISPDAWTNAYAEKDAMRFLPEAWSEFSSATQIEAGILGGVWNSIGPGNIGGRIRSIIIHPTATPRTIWAGGVSGGIWKSTNGGDTWTTNTDRLANLAVTSMVIDPANANILYAGTGEGFSVGDAVIGNGILKTTDGGASWKPLNFTANNPDFAWVNRLAICPTNPQILLAATASGIFRSTDGGDNWSQSTGYGNIRDWVDVRFHEVPQGEQPSFADCLASNMNGNLFYSNDNGVTWETNPRNGLPSPAFLRRIELAYSRSNPRIVYASSAAAGNDRSGLFYSEDGGYTFISLGHPQDPIKPNRPGATFYTNVLWIDPTNANTLLVGGNYVLRSTDGGTHWEEADAFSHQDIHVLVEDPGYNAGTGTTPNATVYSGNDGGVHRTNNILAAFTPPPPGGSVVWSSRNNSLSVTQFYGAAGHAATGIIIGGTQDNGTVRLHPPQFDPEDWDTMAGGDAGYCAVDQTATPYFYGENVTLQIYRNTHDGGGGGFKSENIWGGPGHPSGIPRDECFGIPCANFIAPFVMDPNLDQENEQKTLLAGGRSLWRTVDARVEDATQVAWAEVKSRNPANCTDFCVNISAIAVAEGFSDFIWAGYNNGSVFYTTNGTQPMPTWSSGDPNNMLPQNRSMCTRITIGQLPETNDPQIVAERTVYVTFGGFYPSLLDTRGNVWKRENNGTWTPIHNNLPSAPVFSLVISPSNPHFLYVGTEVGVFASSNGGQTWSPAFGGSSADTLVYSLVVSASSPSSPDIIYAGTEDGVFASKDDGETWSPGFGGPANTRVAELFWMVTTNLSISKELQGPISLICG